VRHNTQKRAAQSGWMVFLSPQTSLNVALSLLRQTDAFALPVLDGGRYIGVALRDDLMWYAPSPANTLSRWEQPDLLAMITLQEERLVRQVPQVRPDATVSQRLKALAQSAAPLIAETEGDRLYRLLSWRDVLKTMEDFEDGFFSPLAPPAPPLPVPRRRC